MRISFRRLRESIRGLMRGLIGLFGGLAIAACQAESRPVRLGEEECAHCRMRVMTAEYAAELVTRKGRQYVFDDAVCLVSFLRAQPAVAEQAHQLLVADYNHPTHWLPVAEAAFMRSPQLRTPMNGQTAAFASNAEAQSAAHKLNPPGEILSWLNVREHLAR